MNTQSNAAAASFDRQRVVPSAVPLPRLFYWSLRREIWENRSIYLAPLAVAVVFLCGFLISLVHFPATLRALEALPAAQQRSAVVGPYDVAAGVMMVTTILVSVFYCLDALHGERRDRSILFWKSLPVSDLTTVLAKATVPSLVLPVLTSVIGAILQLSMLLVSSAVLLGSGLSPAALWARLPWFRMSLLLLYHMLTVHGLWPLPVYAWLLLVSGWARRAAFLWAVLPVVAIAGIEALAFHTRHFLTFLGDRFLGAGAATTGAPSGLFPTNPIVHITPAMFLASSGLWGGFAVAAAFLAAAVALRRHQQAI